MTCFGPRGRLKVWHTEIPSQPQTVIIMKTKKEVLELDFFWYWDTYSLNEAKLIWREKRHTAMPFAPLTASLLPDIWGSCLKALISHYSKKTRINQEYRNNKCALFMSSDLTQNIKLVLGLEYFHSNMRDIVKHYLILAWIQWVRMIWRQGRICLWSLKIWQREATVKFARKLEFPEMWKINNWF